MTICMNESNDSDPSTNEKPETKKCEKKKLGKINCNVFVVDDLYSLSSYA